jgi:DNA-binding winged helix-turn-helix (wHTH) protein/tetratricopeptide (TPR) repeat protein
MTLGASPDVPSLVPFTVGDWLVEPKACHVTRGDIVVKLRPQLVDLLVCLARRAGGIVLKDEILAEVWPGQFVAESGLSRCVAELRQILQDDAQEPRFIETFPKRGYRLIAPVVWLAHTESVTSREGAQAGDAAVAAERPVPDAVLGRRHAAGWRRHMWVAGAMAMLAVGIAAIALVFRSPASALTEQDTVLLADVNNTTGDRVFDDTLRLALAVSLEQAPFLRFVPQEAVRSAVVRAGRAPDERVVGPLALDVCRREGAAVLLAASIAPMGSRYAIGIEAIGCRTGEALARALAEADSREHVIEALERAATLIRERLGESRASLRQHDVPLVRATTPSLEALKALTLGDFSRDHARIEEALAFYRRATELDPDFALAWARRGTAARNLDLMEEAGPAFRRAFELKDRVSPPEGFYIAAAYHRLVEGDPQKAIEIYQTWKRMYPGSEVPPTNLASTLSAWMGDYDAALPEAREAVLLRPYSSLAYSSLIFACLGTGRIADARAALADAANHGVGDRLIHSHLLNMALLDGDQPAVEREMRWAAGDSVMVVAASRLRASAAMAAGRLREGRRLWSEALAKADAAGSARGVAGVRLDQAEAEALVGDARAARHAVEAGLVAENATATLLLSSIAFDLAGAPTRARAILDAVDPQTVRDPASLRVWLPVARSLNAASLGHADDARGFIKPATPFERGYAFGLIPLGVRAIVEQRAQRPAEAAAAFEELVGLRSIGPSSPWVPFAQLGLARALRESGQTAKSLAAYDAFLASWKNADTDAPLLAIARRERAAAAPR